MQLAFAVGIRVKNRPIYRTQIPTKLTFTARASVPTSYKTTTAGSALALQYRIQEEPQKDQKDQKDQMEKRSVKFFFAELGHVGNN